MRTTRMTLLLLFATALACRSGKTVPEDGAVLLHVKRAPGAPTPDALVAWVYDETGRLWDGVRLPAEGPLAASAGDDLGTILIQPGAIQGKLRIHLRAFAAGERLMDGVLTVASLTGGERTFDLMMDSAPMPDGDGDGVPDEIDDCAGVANPTQGGCPSPGQPDGGPDAQEDTQADAAGDSAPSPPDGSSDEPEPTDQDAIADIGAEPDRRADEGDAPATDGADAWPSVDAGGAPACDGDDCKKAQGLPCMANGDCSSGWCADGVCCTNACLGPCRSCNQPSSTGVCQGYPAGSDPDLECPTSSCNGVGACGPATSNLGNGSLCNTADQCASGFCADGVCCDAACDQPCQACGTGACLSVKKADDIPECTGAATCNPRGVCVNR